MATMWTCDCCGVEVHTHPDGGYRWSRPWGAKCRDWYLSHRFDGADAPEPTPGPAYTFSDKFQVCPRCLEKCWHCGEPIVPAAEGLDSYDPGAAFPRDPGSMLPRWLCVACFERLCPECREDAADCVCESAEADQ